MGEMKKLGLCLCIMLALTGIKLVGQERGDFMLSKSILYGKSKNQKPIKDFIGSSKKSYSRIEIVSEKPKESYQFDFGFNYFIFDNIGVSIDAGFHSQYYWHKGKTDYEFSENEIITFIQTYKFRRYGIGTIIMFPINSKFNIGTKYLFSMLKNYNYYDSYLLPLQEKSYQHSLKVSANYTANSFFIFGLEFLATIPSTNMVNENIVGDIEFRPLTWGGGLVVSYILN